MEAIVFSWEFALVAGSYFAILVGFTLLSFRPGPTDREYFLAQRKIPFFFAFVSVVATETSVATVLVFPQIGYQGQLSLLWLPLGFIFGRWLVARFYLPRIYKNHELSIYAGVSAGRLAQGMLSLAYLAAKFISGGVRFFLGSYALAHLFGGETWIWGLIMAGAVGIYSLLGGLRAVVWTDQIQGAFIFFVGLALVFLLGQTLALQGEATEAFSFSLLFNFEASISNAQFSPMLFLGGLVLSIGTHGADQDMLQRVLATPDLRAAQRSLLYSGLGAFAVIAVYLGLGYLLRLHGIEGLDPKTPLIDYVQSSENNILIAFFAVLLFAAAMSTIDSALHSTGAVWKSLFLARQGRFSSGPFYSFLSLLCLCVFSQGAAYLNEYAPDFLSLAMGSMNYINGGLIGIFTLFIFSANGLRTKAVFAALLTGFTITFAAEWLLESRPAWTYTTLASAGGAFLAAWLANTLAARVHKKAGSKCRPE